MANQRKKRLAIINTHPIQYYAPLYQLLVERGQIDLKVFFTKKETDYRFDKGFGKKVIWDIPLLDGYNYEFAPANTKWPFFNHQLVQKIKVWQPDAILVTGWNFPGHLSVMRYFKGKVPIFFRGDSHLLDEKPGIKRTLRRFLLTNIYRHIDFALYVGSNNKKYYLAHQLHAEQLLWAPHAIDNNRFVDNGEKHYACQAIKWRTKLGLQEDHIVFLYAGKLEPVKNIPPLIKAFKAILNDKVRLLIIGDGPEEDLLKKLALGDSRIVFIGFQNQSMMPVVYRLGDIFVLPSKSETWGLAVNEAMACSRPVIISDKVGCGIDLVKPDYGRIFSIECPKTLQKALNDFILPKDLVKEMGQYANEAIRNWSFENFAKTLENCLT